MLRVVALIVASMALLLIAACTEAPVPANGDPSPDDVTITVGTTSEPLTLHPHNTNDRPSARVMRQVYDTLVDQTEALELIPSLAERWTQVDDVTWDFEIRPGVTFHDGSPLTASDVVFTLERLRNPATAAPAAFLLGAIDTIDLVDDMSVRIVTSAPFAPILTHLAQTSTAILSERAVTEAGAAYGTTVVVGTGPFRFVSWDAGSEIVLDRNDDWWRGDVGPKRVVFRALPDPATRAAQLESSAIDV